LTGSSSRQKSSNSSISELPKTLAPISLTKGVLLQVEEWFISGLSFGVNLKGE